MLHKRGYKFHVAQPGIIVEDGKLYANSQYAFEEVHYTFDGSEPTMDSPLWREEPVVVPSDCKLVKAKAFYLGNQSVTTYLFLK